MADPTVSRIELSRQDVTHVDLAREALAQVEAREGNFAEPSYAADFLKLTIEDLLRIIDEGSKTSE